MRLLNNSAIKIELFPKKKNKQRKKQQQNIADENSHMASSTYTAIQHKAGDKGAAQGQWANGRPTSPPKRREAEIPPAIRTGDVVQPDPIGYSNNTSNLTKRRSQNFSSNNSNVTGDRIPGSTNTAMPDGSYSYGDSHGKNLVEYSNVQPDRRFDEYGDQVHATSAQNRGNQKFVSPVNTSLANSGYNNSSETSNTSAERTSVDRNSVQSSPGWSPTTSRKAFGVEQLAPNSHARVGWATQKSPNSKTNIAKNMAAALSSKKSREKLNNKTSRESLNHEQARAGTPRPTQLSEAQNQNQTPPRSREGTQGPSFGALDSASNGRAKTSKPPPARSIQSKHSKETLRGMQSGSAKVPESINHSTSESTIAKRRSNGNLTKDDKTTKANNPVYVDGNTQTSPLTKRHDRQKSPPRSNVTSHKITYADSSTTQTTTSRVPQINNIKAQERSRSRSQKRSQSRSRSQPRNNFTQSMEDRAQQNAAQYKQTGVSPVDWASKAAADRKRQPDWQQRNDTNTNKQSETYTNGSMPSVDAHVKQNRVHGFPGQSANYTYSPVEHNDDSYGKEPPNMGQSRGRTAYNTISGYGSPAYNTGERPFGQMMTSPRAAGRV